MPVLPPTKLIGVKNHNNQYIQFFSTFKIVSIERKRRAAEARRFRRIIDIQAVNVVSHLLNKLGAIESLGSVESTFVMSEVKHNDSIPI